VAHPLDALAPEVYVEPDVGIGSGGRAGGKADLGAGYTVGEVEHGAVFGEAVQDVAHLTLQVEAAGYDEVCLGEETYIGEAGLEEVRVGTGAHQGTDVSAGPGYVAEGIGGEGGGGDEHRRLLPAVAGSRIAAHRQNEAEACRYLWSKPEA